MKALRLITFAAIVNYVAMVGLGMWKIVPATRGLQPFDLRYFGYSYEETIAYLGVLRFETAELLLGPVRWLDTSFPALFTFTLIGWGLVFSENLKRPFRLLTVVLPIAYLVLDYYENHLVAKMIAGVLPSPEQVAMASTITIGKFVAVGLSMMLVFVLAFFNSDKETAE